MKEGLKLLLCLFIFVDHGLCQSFYGRQGSPLQSQVNDNQLDPNPTCDLCLQFASNILTALQGNASNEQIGAVVASNCKQFQLDKPYICDALVPQFGPEVRVVLTNANLDAKTICGTLISNCGESSGFKDTLWPLKIPGNKPPVKPWPRVRPGLPTMRVLHLSDIHIDRSYTAGRETNCTTGSFLTNTMCCRPYPDDNDTVTPVQVPAGYWGMTANCDLPYQTFISALWNIKRTQKLDYIIVTGDLVAHDIWNYSKDATIENLNNITSVLNNFFPNTPIYQSAGNHEGVPMDGFAPHSLPGYDDFGPQWLYDEFAKLWIKDLGSSVIPDIKYRASYAVYIKKGLRLISLNSVYCSEWNFYLVLNPVDPDGTLEWLIWHLQDAEKRGEKVHIISHIPPGEDYCLKGWSFNFYDIVNRFENTIAAMFFGHTHKDEFNVYYENGDPKGRATHFNWITPSLTTYSFVNPAYRIYEIDGAYPGSSYTVLDAETYFTDLNEANRNYYQGPIWRLEYRTKKDLEMPDLSPDSWNNLIKRMDKDNSLFDKYNRWYSRNAKLNPNCSRDLQCKAGMICSMKSARSYDKANLCK